MEVWTTDPIDENDDTQQEQQGYYWDIAAPRDGTLYRSTTQTEYSTHTGSKSITDKYDNIESVHDIRDIFIDDTTSYWKWSLGAFAGANVLFILSVAVFLMTISSGNIMYMQIGGVMGIVALVARIGGSYYLYKDISYVKRVTVEFSKHVQRDFVGGWRPSSFIWVAASLFSPPFGEIAILAVYLFRRHRRTGVP